jgi:hypothetical protein
MDEPLPVRLLERVGHLEGAAQQLRGRHRPSLESRGERLPYEMLHDQKVDSILAPDVMQRADMRVVEARHCARFALEPLPSLRMGRQVSGKDLDGDGAIQPSVSSTVHLAHPARAERAKDLVGAQACARLQSHRGQAYQKEGPRPPARAT